MEKFIKITVNPDGTTSFDASGMNTVEVLGTLRYHEKAIWLKMAEAAKLYENKIVPPAKTDRKRPNRA